MCTRVYKWLRRQWLIPFDLLLSCHPLTQQLLSSRDTYSPCLRCLIRLSPCSSLGTHSSVTSRPPVRLARRVRDGPPLCSRAECCPTHQTWRRKWWRTTWQCTRSLEPTRYPTLTWPSCDTHAFTHRQPHTHISLYEVDLCNLQIKRLITSLVGIHLNLNAVSVHRIKMSSTSSNHWLRLFVSATCLCEKCIKQSGSVSFTRRPCIKRNIQFVCRCERLCK